MSATDVTLRADDGPPLALRRRLARSVAALALSLAASAAAAPAAARAFSLDVPLLFADAPLGSVSAKVDMAGGFDVDRSRVLALLDDVLSPARIAALKAALGPSARITAADAARAGAPLRFDASQVALVYQPALEELPEIGLRFGDDAFETPTETHAPEPVAGRINYALFGSSQQGGDSGADLTYSGDLSAALNLASVVLEGDAYYSQATTGDDLYFDNIRATYDVTDHNLRLRAGQLNSFNDGFLQGPAFWGGSIEYDPSDFGPSRARSPGISRNVAIQSTSTVEIYVNGRLSRRLTLRPGRYALRDLAVGAGGFDVQLVIEDAVGRKEVIDIDRTVGVSQIAEGALTFRLSGGVFREEFETDGLSFEGGDPVATATATYGAANWLSLRPSLVYDRARLGGELAAFAATPIGAFEVIGAMASGGGEDAYGAELLYETGLPTFGALESLTLDAGLFYESGEFEPEFGGFQATTDQRYGGDLSLDADFPDRLRVSFDLSFQRTIALSGDVRETGLASVGGRYGWGPANLFASVGYEHDQDDFGDDDSGAFVSFGVTYRWGRDTAAGLRGDSRRNALEAGLRHNRMIAGVGALGVELTGGVEDGATEGDSEQFAELDIDLETQRAVLDANFEQESDRTEASLGVRGALVFAGGRVGLSRPVADSFAIVDVAEPLSAFDLQVGRSALDRLPDAESGFLGPAVVANLGSYSERTLSASLPGAPVDAGGLLDAATVFPGFSSGYHITLGSERVGAVLGAARSPDGAPLGLRLGRVDALDDPGFEPTDFFTNRIGRFYLPGLKPGARYRLSLPITAEDGEARVLTAVVAPKADMLAATQVGDTLFSPEGAPE